MKFQVGDKVLLLHAQEEGTIVDIINDKMVLVEVDGVQFPVYKDQIDHPYLHRFTQPKKPTGKVKKYVDDLKPEKRNDAIHKYRVEKGVWLALLPVFDKDIFDDDVVEYFRVYLVNNTSDAFVFSYWLMLGQDCDFELRNEVLPFQDFYLHDVAFEKFNDNPRFVFEFSLKVADKKRSDYYEVNFKIRNKQLFKRIEEIQLKREATITFLLFDHYPDKPEHDAVDLSKLTSAGYKLYPADKAKPYSMPPRTVVDLHIEKLTDDWKHLSNMEILDLQMKEFEKFFDAAVAYRQPSLIVIHGVGKGRLRDEIHEWLRYRPEVKSFVNQYHPSFGYGATEIFFQYTP